MSKQNLNPPIGTFDENEKVMAPQSRRGKEFQKKITIHYKAHSRTPKKIFLGCYVVIRVERRFVEFQVALL